MVSFFEYGVGNVKMANGYYLSFVNKEEIIQKR